MQTPAQPYYRSRYAHTNVNFGMHLSASANDVCPSTRSQKKLNEHHHYTHGISNRDIHVWTNDVQRAGHKEWTRCISSPLERLSQYHVPEVKLVSRSMWNIPICCHFLGRPLSRPVVVVVYVLANRHRRVACSALAYGRARRMLYISGVVNMNIARRSHS